MLEGACLWKPPRQVGVCGSSDLIWKQRLVARSQAGRNPGRASARLRVPRALPKVMLLLLSLCLLLLLLLLCLLLPMLLLH